MAHLHHFCSILPQQPYVDNKPMFSFESNKAGHLRGTVILPSCVHPSVRRTVGKRWWVTERAAMKETAFEAYKALYKFGLVNDNLLPLTRKPELRADEKLRDLPSVVGASDQYDPWVDWAYSWSSPSIHQSRISVQLNGNVVEGLTMDLTGPTLLPLLEPMTLFWDKENTFTLSFDDAQPTPLMTPDHVEHMRKITLLYLQATTQRKLGKRRDFVTLFSPAMEHEQLEAWLLENNGHSSAFEAYSRETNHVVMGIVRDNSKYGEPLVFKRWVSDPSGVSSMVELECEQFPRRRNFLPPNTLANTQLAGPGETDMDTPNISKVRIVSASKCTVDKLPFEKAIFGLFISVIVDRLEAALLATKLRDSILTGVGFRSTHHIITAVTAPSAQVLTDYQRYEFLGDSVLKFTVSCQMYYQHPNWHEGYLTEGRDAIVQNNRLARAAMDTGLDAFIITKMFIPRKWKAPTISERLERVPAQRAMSTKTLADVVEALIGAAYLEGGQQMAQACMHRFMPEISMQALDARSPNKGPKRHVKYHNLDRLQSHLGYSFIDDSLLIEALTHPSCDYDESSQSYQRLEFLGDAVLDMIIVSAIWHTNNNIPPGQMTLLKHAMVNANLLAFFCMEFALPEEKTHIEQVPGELHHFNITKNQHLVELWRFMRYRGTELTKGRNATVARHRHFRGNIIHALQNDSRYPWQPLAQLSADKFFSDLYESVLGAIFVDSGGDLEECALFVDRTGLLGYLHRVLTVGVDVSHPRNMAQRLARDVPLKFENRKMQNGADEGASYTCSVVLGDTEICAANGCSSGEVAEVTAANAALEILRMGQ